VVSYCFAIIIIQKMELRPLPKLDPGSNGKGIYFDCEAVSDPKTFELEDDPAVRGRPKSQHTGKGKQKADILSDEEDAEKKLTKRERKEVGRNMNAYLVLTNL
jgi:hypothetical protein